MDAGIVDAGRMAPPADKTEYSAGLIFTCPPNGTSSLVSEIRARGNCPLDVCGRFLAELPAPMIRSGLAETRSLTKQQTRATMQSLAIKLADADTGDELDELVSEAAAFFLLSLREQGITASKALSGCRVTWHPAQALAQVESLD